MDLMLSGTLGQTKSKVYDPDSLPKVWPLVDSSEVTPETAAAYRAHLKACDEGEVPRIQAELIRCQRRPDYWVMAYCFTKDEHDSRRPVKRFPRYLYIPDLITELATNKKVAVPKSRQVMVTWTVLAWLLHQSVFLRHQLNFVQSKKEEDAAAHIDRQKHMYEYLPWWQKAASPLKRPMSKMPYNKIYLANGSTNWGIPQGSDIARQYTCSKFFCDEAAFQDRAEEAYKASKPTIDGGGQYIAVSSVNGKGFFYRICTDQLHVSQQALV